MDAYPDGFCSVIMPPPGLLSTSDTSQLPDGLVLPVSNEVAAPVTPLYKTRFCEFHKRGACTKGDRCPYAHGKEDLRPSPDFERTALCPNMRTKGRCNNAWCRYAHTFWELRPPATLLKTKMCGFNANGRCDMGEACRFAHSTKELQDAICVSRAGTSPPGLLGEGLYEEMVAPEVTGKDIGLKSRDNDSDQDTFVRTESDSSLCEASTAKQSSGDLVPLPSDISVEAPLRLNLDVQEHTRLKSDAPDFVPIGFAAGQAAPLFLPFAPLDFYHAESYWAFDGGAMLGDKQGRSTRPKRRGR